MDYRHWKVTFRDAEGVEIDGWYNGSRSQAQAWAESHRVSLGAIAFSLEDARPLWTREAS